MNIFKKQLKEADKQNTEFKNLYISVAKSIFLNERVMYENLNQIKAISILVWNHTRIRFIDIPCIDEMVLGVLKQHYAPSLFTPFVNTSQYPSDTTDANVVAQRLLNAATELVSLVEWKQKLLELLCSKWRKKSLKLLYPTGQSTENCTEVISIPGWYYQEHGVIEISNTKDVVEIVQDIIKNINSEIEEREGYILKYKHVLSNAEVSPE